MESGHFARCGLSQGKILIVEDEENLAEALRYTLGVEGYEAMVAHDGVEGLEMARAEDPDLIVLDITLPKLDGLSLCRILRQESEVTVLMLTARGEEDDRVAGLDVGADDYVTKPFSLRELVARVRALLRRRATRRPGKPIGSSDVAVDPVSRRAWVGDKQVELTRMQFNLLSLLVQNAGRAFSRNEILNEVWGEEWIGDQRTVDVHVRWVREKIEDDPGDPQRLVTVRGFGYRFDG